MIIGSIGAAGNGVAQPVSFIIFGKLIEKFIDFVIVDQLKEDLKSGKINESFYNMSMANITDVDLEEEMKGFALWYVIIAAVMFVCAFVQAGFWSMTALRQTHKIRKKFFHSILKQDIGWFDCNESGGLLSRLTE